jgi:ankyrin repeat protein
MESEADIFAALRLGDAGKVATLLEADPSLVNARNDSGDSPMLVAAYVGRQDLIAILLEKSPDVSLFEAAALGMADRVLELLAREPSAIHAFSHDGWTALHLAAFFGRSEIARILLDHGADVNARSRNERFGREITPLHAAAANRHLAAAEILLDRGAEVNARDRSGFTPLALAADGRNDLLVILLLERGGNVG